MGRDGMLPQIFAQVSPRTQTPVHNTIIVAIVVAHPGGVRAAGLPDRRGVDRHPDRVHRRLARRDHPAPPRAGPAARLQGSRLPGHADPVDPRLRLHPGQPALVHLAGLRLLGRRVPRLLPAVRAQALGARPELAGEDVDADDAEVDADDRRRRLRPAQGGRGALDLGLQLAHARGDAMAVVTVVPRQWTTPSLARVDAEYAEYARQVGEQAEAQARDYLRDTSVDVRSTTARSPGRSVSVRPDRGGGRVRRVACW